QKDPIGAMGGLNLYSFAQNNPVTHADPSGLFGPEVSALLQVLYDNVVSRVGAKAAVDVFDRAVVLACNDAHLGKLVFDEARLANSLRNIANQRGLIANGGKVARAVISNVVRGTAGETTAGIVAAPGATVEVAAA